MEIQFKIETQLINMNQLASYTFSKLTGQYAKLKKVSEMLIRAEIERQVEVKNYFGSNNTRCFYEWHTNTNFDLGNIAVGEKFLADSINELGLWDDDRYITEIHHKKVVDKEYNYVIVTIKGAKKKMIERNRDIFILNYDINSEYIEKLEELGFEHIPQCNPDNFDIISINMKRKNVTFEKVPTRNNYVHGSWNMFISYLEDISADLDYPEYNYTTEYLESFREDESDLKNEPKEDIVEHPNHYNSYSLETIEAIKGQSTKEEFRGYLKGNIMKYISRYQFKNGLEDLEKAEWYLKRLIKEVEEDE